MAVNYSDDRLVAVEREENKATTEINKTYNDMIEQSDGYYQAQINASKEWADKQTQLQQEKTDFAIEQIEQQKDKAEKDYTKEQSGAYVDWQKQSNAYGVNAEQMASQGMTNTGYAESSQVSMYNTYQNRVASAREVFNQIIMNYNNNIKEAQLQNNSAIAEIYANAQQQQLELMLQQFQYKNTLVTEKLDKKMQTQQIYHQQYQDVLDQINKEQALAEEIRQFNAQLEEEKRQYNQSYALQQQQLAFEQQKYANSLARSSSGGSSGGSSSSSSSVKKSSSSSSAKTTKSSSANASTPKVSTTGAKLGHVLSNSQINALGLSSSDKVLADSSGNYYVKKGANLVDLSPIKAVINNNNKFTGKINLTK